MKFFLPTTLDIRCKLCFKNILVWQSLGVCQMRGLISEFASHLCCLFCQLLIKWQGWIWGGSCGDLGVVACSGSSISSLLNKLGAACYPSLREEWKPMPSEHVNYRVHRLDGTGCMELLQLSLRVFRWEQLSEDVICSLPKWFLSFCTARNPCLSHSSQENTFVKTRFLLQEFIVYTCDFRTRPAWAT